MREWTETHREGTDVGPVDWTHETAKDMPPEWREAEQHPERFRFQTAGGFNAFELLKVCSYDGWPYWKPRPALQFIGPMDLPEWNWFDSYGVGPGSLIRVKP